MTTRRRTQREPSVAKPDAELAGGTDSTSFPYAAVLYLRVSTPRQARKGGEAEGYSIPAQRTDCQRRADSLNAEVVAEFVEKGESAKSADRTELQAMLRHLSLIGQINPETGQLVPRVDYVIVHSIDRLVRNRADDVAIGLAVTRAGARLVSVKENIDETPTGQLIHGVMSSVAEFYSANLSLEAKKGMREKAKRGGTIGKAPIGYLNVTRLIDGHEARTVVVDEERAPHVVWAFDEFSKGDVSLSRLTEQLAARGLRTKQSVRYGAKPLSRAQVHRTLTNPYYKGVVSYEGVEYPAQHPPLVDAETFARIDQLLVDRRASGDRSWKRTHHLRGIIYCGRCGSRLGQSESRGKSGELYDYFYCLGRNKRRTDCDFPYVLVSVVESAVRDLITQATISAEELDGMYEAAVEEVERQTTDGRELATQAERRLSSLTKKRDRLVDAYLADALTIDQLKAKQAEISGEIAEAERIVEGARASGESARARLSTIRAVLSKPVRLYDLADDTGKRLVIGALYGGRIEVYEEDDSDGGAGIVTAESEHTEVVAAACEAAGEVRRGWAGEADRDASAGLDGAVGVEASADGSGAADDTPGASSLVRDVKNPGRHEGDRGSNVVRLAEDGGFEPPRVLSQHAFQACAIGH